jgi:hypothetical protein
VLQDRKSGTSGGSDDFEALAAPSWEDEVIDRAGALVDRAKLWMELELGRERRQWIPWRSCEEEAEDEDRMVSMEDIGPFLFQFHSPVQPARFLLCFLDFLGIRFRDEPFRSSCLETQTLRQSLGLDAPETVSPDVDWHPDIIAPILQKVTPDLQLDDSYLAYCRNVFAQSVKVYREPFKTQLSRLWLRFEVMMAERCALETNKERKAKAKQIKVITKDLLQDDQSNMAIYAELAAVEYKLCGFASAWKILVPVLTSTGAQPSLDVFKTAIAIVLQEAHEALDCNQEVIDEATWLMVLAAEAKP